MLALLGGFWPCSHLTLRYFIDQGHKIAQQTFSRGHNRRCLEREEELSSLFINTCLNNMNPDLANLVRV